MEIGTIASLLSLFLIDRDENAIANPVLVESDVKELYKAGEGKLGTNERVFIEIFSGRSFSHLKEVFSLYQKYNKRSECDLLSCILIS